MTYEVDFVPFSTQAGANVLTQAQYLALSALSTGFVAGTAQSAAVNKALAQSSTMAAVLANFISQYALVNVIDDGNVATKVSALDAAVANIAQNALIVGAGSWISTATYPINSVVNYNGAVYAAVASNTNSAPPSSNWVVIASAAGVQPWASTEAYAAGNIVSLGGALYTAVASNTNSSPPSANWTQITASGALANWSSTIAYTANQVVAYQGALYTCTTGNTNSAPPSSNWALVASATGVQAWNSSQTYASGVTVAYNGGLYTALSSNTNQNPASATTFWTAPATTNLPSGTDNSLLSTTDFVQRTVGGLTTVNVAGNTNVVLSAAQAGTGLLKFTGALTGNITVTVPAAPTRDWQVLNATTGAFSLTVLVSAGTGVAVPQGYSQVVFTDGTNVYDAAPAASLSGNAFYVPTPAQFDASNQPASSAFVQSALGNRQGVFSYSSAQTLTTAQYGAIVKFTGSSPATYTLPTPVGVSGGSFIFVNLGTATLTLSTPAGNFTGPNGSGASTMTVAAGASVEVITDSANFLAVSGAGVASKGSSGYLITASGMILQYGSATTLSTGGTLASLPISFTSASTYRVTASSTDTVNPTTVNATPSSGSQFNINGWNVSTRVATTLSFIAMGY